MHDLWEHQGAWDDSKRAGHVKTCEITDSGYTGIKKLQKKVRLPKKASKKKALTREEKKQKRLHRSVLRMKM